MLFAGDPVWTAVVAAMIALALSSLNVLFANLAFEESYRRGFFTAGTLFGLHGGILGLLFVKHWNIIGKPNLVNEMQLQSTEDNDHARWGQGLLLGQAGWAVVYWQLLLLAVIRSPALAPHWLWLVALALMGLGWLRFRGSCPPISRLVLIEPTIEEEPADLLGLIKQRQAWGQLFYRALGARRLALLLVGLAVAAVLGAGIRVVFGGGLAGWLWAGGFLLIAAGGVFGALVLRGRAEDDLYESGLIEQQAAPTPRHVKLLKLQRQFAEGVNRLNASRAYQRLLVLGAGGLFALALIFELASDEVSYGAALTFAIVILLGAGAAAGWLSWRDMQTHQELELVNAAGEQVAAEFEEELLREVQENRQQYLGEVYHFESGGLVGEQLEIPEFLQRRINERKLLDSAQKQELDAERMQQTTAQAQLLFDLAMAEERIGLTRDITVTIALVLFAGSGLSLILGGAAEAVRLLWQIGLACVAYAGLLSIALKIQVLRNSGCWTTVGLIFYIAVIVMVFKAGSYGMVDTGPL